MKFDQELIKEILSDPNHKISVQALTRRGEKGNRFDWKVNLEGNKKHFSMTSDCPFSSYEEAIRVGHKVIGCLKAKVIDGTVR